MNAGDVKVKLTARLDINTKTEEKIENFTKALKELPLDLEIRISVDGVDAETPLKLSLADLLIEQVKKHFNKK